MLQHAQALQFWAKLQETGKAEGRFFNTWRYDFETADRSLRNAKATPRIGSNAFVTGVYDHEEEIFIRIVVKISEHMFE